MKKTLLIALACLMIAPLSFAQKKAQSKDYTQYVDTRVGTNSKFELSHGNTYPSTGRPFGVHLWSAQTGLNGNGWKYTYPAEEIRGFCQSHQCSPWANDYAVYSMMPEVGELVLNVKDRGAKFSHDKEIARPHYYKVALENGITVEMAPTERGNHIRFAFPKKGDAYIVLDGYTAMSAVSIDPVNKQITGWVDGQKRNVRQLKSYFVIQFDTPFTDYGVWENHENTVKAGAKEDEGAGVGAYVKFKKGAKVNIKCASSYVSPEQALVNLQRELGANKTLEVTKQQGQDAWNECLGRIDVEGGTDEEIRTFYAMMYHANLFSRKFYEIDADNNPIYRSPYDFEVHQGYMFTDNGFWDTFRSQFPLSNILHPTMQGQYMQALLDAYDQFGWLPSWSSPGEGGGMVGNHAISLLADAWAKGIRNFDPQKALEAYVHDSMDKGPAGPSNGRQGWKDYWTLGYVSYPGTKESTAKTLEYAYDDWCAYKLASMVGNDFVKNIYKNSMYNYRNLFDTKLGFMRGKDNKGKWIEPFDPAEWGGPFTEGSSWHYTWSVFQDVQGLINLFGSDEAFTKQLDAVFSTPNDFKVGTYNRVIHEMAEMVEADMGQYAHGNQPIQHMPYLYNYAGQPWKTQYWVREIMRRLYHSGPDGYPGDEDQGGMSSWYVLSALGIYSVTPGTDEYVIGSPVFQKATVTLEDGQKFTVIAENNSQQNVYIQSATLNGKNLDKNYIHYSDIANGGELHLVMGPEPNKTRNITKEASPFSLSASK